LKGQVLFANAGGQPRGSFEPDRNNFAPRAGVAYRIRENWVIRGGYGLYYLGQSATGSNQGYSQRTNAITTLDNLVPAVTVSNAFSLLPGGQLLPAVGNSQGAASFLGQSLGVNYINRPLPYSHQYSFDIQHEFKGGVLIEASYVGNRGVRLTGFADINAQAPSIDGSGARPFAGKFPWFSYINEMTNDTHSNYNSLQASLTQRAWRGLSFVAGYTWAHALDQASLNRAAQPQDSLHPEKEYASSDIDIRHRFTLALSYELPGRKSFAQMLEGWQVNSIVTVQSGLPWSVIDGFVNGNDVSSTGEFSDRWDFFGSPSDFKPSVAGIPVFAGSGNPANPTTNASCNAQALAMDGGVASGPASGT
jgi:hypothetical protein